MSSAIAPAISTPDHLASIPVKLTRLFGLKAGDRVRLPIQAPAKWSGEFAALGIFTETQSSQRYALLIETDPSASTALIKGGKLREMLSEDGVALLQITQSEAPWRALLRRLGRRLRRNADPVPRTFTLNGEYGQLAFTAACIQPDLGALEQLDLLPTTRKKHGAEVHVPAALVTAPLIIVLSRNGHPFAHPLAHLHELLPEADESYQLHRILLRSRGALMLSLQNRVGERHIARLCGSADIAAVVGKNCEALNQLHQNQYLPTFCRQRIPRVIAHSAETFIEEQLPGVLGWQLIDMTQPPAGTILSDAWEFSLGLSIATAKETNVSPDLVQRLIGNDIQFLQGFFAGDTQLLNTLTDFQEQLNQALVAQTLPIVTAHGDYGYGNLLCDPATGRLTGVIDWDTCRDTELPGIDFLNLLIQHLRMQVGLATAPRSVFAWLNADSAEPVEIRLALRKLFHVDEQSLPLYIRIAVLHLMGRDFRYRVPGSLNQEERNLALSLALPLN